MRFHVCGAGSVGSLLAWHIRRVLPKHDALSLIIRPSHLRHIRYPRQPSITLRQNGVPRTIGGFELEVIRKFDTAQAQDIAVVNALASHEHTAPPYGRIDSVFVTTKAHQVYGAFTSLVGAGRISERTTIVLLNNGMGVYEQLVSGFFQDPEKRPQFILATNTHGAYPGPDPPLDVVYAGKGRIHYGIMDDPLQRDRKLPTELTEATPFSTPSGLQPE